MKRNYFLKALAIGTAGCFLPSMSNSSSNFTFTKTVKIKDVLYDILKDDKILFKRVCRVFEPYYLNAPIQNYSEKSHKVIYKALGVLLYAHDNNLYYSLCFQLIDYYDLNNPHMVPRSMVPRSYYIVNKKENLSRRIIESLEQIEKELCVIEI